MDHIIQVTVVQSCTLMDTAQTHSTIDDLLKIIVLFSNIINCSLILVHCQYCAIHL